MQFGGELRDWTTVSDESTWQNRSEAYSIKKTVHLVTNTCDSIVK
jgi:hypothetical protein